MVERECPICGRSHEVADDGTIATWNVRWTGDEAPQFGPSAYTSRRAQQPERNVADIPGYISNREENFIHFEDAQSEYDWIKGILQKRGDWIRMQEFLVLEDGDRASWYDLFEEPDTNWMA